MKLLLFILLNIPFLLFSQNKADSILSVLNTDIDNQDIYYKIKEDKIDSLKSILININNTDEIFSLQNELFNGYKSYQYDSALVYAIKMKDLSIQTDNLMYQTISDCNLLFSYISSGLFNEATQIASGINSKNLPDSLKVFYYFQFARLQSDMGMYNNSDMHRKKYNETKKLYCDSALMYLQPNTFDYDYIQTFQNLSDTDNRKSIQKLTNLIDSYDISEHDRAIIHFYIGRRLENENDMENAKLNMALSAIYDLRSATMENMSKTVLAKYMYDSGNLKLASKYIQAALKEANFYNARHRKVTINTFLPIIEKDRLEASVKQRDILIIFLCIVCVLMATLAFAVYLIFKQLKKLRTAQNTIQQKNGELLLFNEKLNESNEMKDDYIMQLLYYKSEYLDTVEKILKSVNRKITLRRFDDLNTIAKDFNIKAERENIYSAFDQTFLKQFPHFIGEYNRLFNEENAVIPEDDNTLTAELRIFALIRLGIHENERIALFLNISVNTIYTYKARVKAKSIVSKDEFENRILSIQKG